MMLGWRIWFTARASSTKRRTSRGSRRAVRRQHLDRHARADLGLARGVHRAHPALAERPLDPVLADGEPRNELAGVGRRRRRERLLLRTRHARKLTVNLYGCVTVIMYGRVKLSGSITPRPAAEPATKLKAEIAIR